MARDRRFELRVSEEWLGALDEGRGSLSRAAFVVRAVEKALAVSERVAEGKRDTEQMSSRYQAAARGSREGVRRAVESGALEQPVVAPLAEVMARVEPQRLRCPSAGCGFFAPSPNAVCPEHGRKVR